ncbi:hypothetical protein SAMN05216411_1039 [Nitrosospira multiformis]|nr:hypothetical protein SAMN05216411_1039 [Nitrosospira multiformis]
MTPPAIVILTGRRSGECRSDNPPRLKAIHLQRLFLPFSIVLAFALLILVIWI